MENIYHIVLEINNSVSSIGDVFYEIRSNIVLCVTFGNGGPWDVSLSIFTT